MVVVLLDLELRDDAINWRPELLLQDQLRVAETDRALFDGDASIEAVSSRHNVRPVVSQVAALSD